MDSAMYYFDTLPLRWQPQPLESFTSYLTRLAEANGKKRYSQLNPFFEEYRSISRFADYPPCSFGMLPIITKCAETELLKTTFFHVGMKFGRLYDSPRWSTFFSGVVASLLRYCPFCLQEALYYSLSWRFLPLVGCPKHACRLLERCGHCNCPIPIFPSPFRMGVCPTCGGDLRECNSSELPEEELQKVTAAAWEIEFLLCPQPWETTESALPEKLGQEYMLLRYNKQLKRVDISAETELPKSNLEAIELGQSGPRGTALRWYYGYANYLGVPLSQIFMNMLQRTEQDRGTQTMPGKFFLTSEDAVMQRVQMAVSQLENSAKCLTLKAICDATGFSKGGLYKYERVKTFLGGILYHKKPPSHAQDPQYEEHLLQKAQQAILELAQAKKPITHQAVCFLIGVPSSKIVRYPRVKKLVGQFVDYALQQGKRAEACEQLLLKVVRAGVVDLEEHGQPVTYRAIGQKIGIHYSVWLSYVQVREFVEQHLNSQFLAIMRERERREEVLIPRVEEALGLLEIAGKSVSFYSVGRVLGVSANTLKTYPRVNALIEQRKSPLRSQGGQARRSEEDVLFDVQNVVPLLKERGLSINYKAIAREMGGITTQTLRSYPKVRMLVDEHLQANHLYRLQQFALREEQLLRRMEAAIAELEALGKPFTQCDLCEKVGKSRSAIRRYPRVNAVLEQTIARHHVYQRRREQPAEEEMVLRVKEAISDLSDLAERITVKSVARRVKISPEVLMQYPQVVVLLEQHGYQKRKRRSECEEKLLNLVKEAIHACKINEQPITKVRLSSMVGVDRATLFGYAEVRALMTQAADEDRQQRQEHRFRAREEELTRQVLNALQQLRNQNKQITKKAIENIVHISNICSRYPTVKALIEDAIQAQRTSSETAIG